LRTADRVWLVMADFSAPDFDALYEGIRHAAWRELLPRNAAVTVTAKSSRSRLAAVPSIQSISKKAIVDALLGSSGHHSAGRAEETGPQYTVEVSLQHDRASVSVDTSGYGLHKRGYRTESGAAPLRENLAAALVLLSRWDPSRPFADPLCGSGTIAIEAALIARGAAPGIRRTFAAERWPTLPARIWRDARQEAHDLEQRGVNISIHGSDKDQAMVEAARRNAAKAGVLESVSFRCAPLRAFNPAGDYGCVVCNPPYGERLGERREVDSLSRDMGDLYQRLDTWSFFVLTANADFPSHFRAKISRNRKLYNGNIRCYFYQYFRPMHPRRGEP
ncbi:MAG TPA: class I SAM-dependent RNA methyltransferase, partial [Spirochaetia bacterium]|nr:class I SAM-dependent RNA methyltransferase [Spirochaetia bacterium]